MSAKDGIIPVLQVGSVVQATEFYCSRLGFTTYGYTWHGGRRRSCQIDFRTLSVILWEVENATSRKERRPLDPSHYSDIVFWITDIDAYYQFVTQHEVDIITELSVEEDSGVRCFRVRDIDGHLIIFADLDKVLRDCSVEGDSV